jgi:hypothetical protein
VRISQTFGYDARNRMISAAGTGPDGDYGFDYRHDANSNLLRSVEFATEDLVYGQGGPAAPRRERRSGSTTPPAG